MPLTRGSSTMVLDASGERHGIPGGAASVLFRRVMPISQTMLGFCASTASWEIANGGESIKVQLFAPFTVL